MLPLWCGHSGPEVGRREPNFYDTELFPSGAMLTDLWCQLIAYAGAAVLRLNSYWNKSTWGLQSPSVSLREHC